VILEALRRDLRYSSRALAWNKGFNCAAVLTLARHKLLLHNHMRVPLAIAAFALAVSAYGQQQRISTGQPLVVLQDGKYGYIDHKGQLMIKPQFFWATDFEDGLATAYVCGRFVSVDRSGRIQAHRIALKGELVPSRRDAKIGFVDASGRFKISPEFDDALPFSEGLAAVKIGMQWGFIDASGRHVINPRFDNAFYFIEGVAVADLAKQFVLIDRKGKVIARGFDSFLGIAEGRVLVTRRNDFGFIDFNGKVIVPLIYDGAGGEFEGGLASVSKEGKWGYIDTNGKVIIPFMFDEAGPFYGGNFAPAKLRGQTGFIDRSGKFVFPLPYAYSPGFMDGDIARFWTEDQHFGYVNESGKVIWGPAETPDHEPLPGWSDEDRLKSCEGFPESTRSLVASFPRIGE